MKHIFNFFWVLCIFHIVAFTACDNTATGNFENENVDDFSIFEYTTYYGCDEYGNYLSSISFDDKDSKNCVFTLESENLSIPCKWTEKDSCATVTGTGEYSDISFETTKNIEYSFSVTFPIELCKKFNPKATTELVVHYNTSPPSYGEEDYAEIDLLAEETDKGVKFTFTIPNDSEKTITDITIFRVDKNSGGSDDGFIGAHIPSAYYPEEINKGIITLYDYFVEPGEYVYRLELNNARNGHSLIYQSKNTPITVKNPGLYSDLEKVSLKLDSENCIDTICQFFQIPKEIDSSYVDNKEVDCVYKWLTKPTLTDSELPNDINWRFSMELDVDNPNDYSGFYVDYNSTENIQYWKKGTFTFIEGKYSVKKATLNLFYQEDVVHGEQTLNVSYQNNGNEINIKDTILSQTNIDISQENINNAVSFNLGHSTDGNSINIETYNEENSSVFKQISYITVYKSSNGKDYESYLNIYPNHDEEYFTGSVSATDFFVTPGKEYSYICELAVDQREYVFDENGNGSSSENSGAYFSIYSNIKTVTTDDNAETREINDIALTTADLSFDKYSKQYKWNAEPQITGIPEEILQDGYELKLNYKLNDSSIYLSYKKGDYSYPEIGSFHSYLCDGDREDLEKGVYTLDSVSLDIRSEAISKADYNIRYSITDSYDEALSLSFEDVALQTIDLTPYVPPFTIENTSEGVKFTIAAEDDCTISKVRIYRTSADDSVEYNFSQNYSDAVSEAVFYDPYVGNDKEYTYYCEVHLSTPNDYYGEWYTTEEKSIVVSGVTNPFDASCISVTKPELEFNAETMEYTWTTPPTVTTELPDDFVWLYEINYTNYINGDDAGTSSFGYLSNYESNNNSFYLDSGYTASYKETCIILYDENYRRYNFTIPVDVIPDDFPQEIVGK
ncbi:MAG: hypothetical protein UHW86_06305 [Spirochaetota bacterium]|nr:hypothetical protein [Spirochaetota bacterium]